MTARLILLQFTRFLLDRHRFERERCTRPNEISPTQNWVFDALTIPVSAHQLTVIRFDFTLAPQSFNIIWWQLRQRLFENILKGKRPVFAQICTHPAWDMLFSLHQNLTISFHLRQIGYWSIGSCVATLNVVVETRIGFMIERCCVSSEGHWVLQYVPLAFPIGCWSDICEELAIGGEIETALKDWDLFFTLQLLCLLCWIDFCGAAWHRRVVYELAMAVVKIRVAWLAWQWALALDAYARRLRD